MPTDLEKLAKILQDASGKVQADNEYQALIELVKLLFADIRGHKKTLASAIEELRQAIFKVSKLPGPIGKIGKTGPAGADGIDCDPEEIAQILRRDRAFMNLLKPKEGKPGERGATPSHEWNETSLRFQNADGSWGPWVDLRGPRTSGGFGGLFGGGVMGIERLRFGSTVLEGVTNLEFAGSGISSIVKTPNGARVNITGGGSGGTGGGLTDTIESLDPTQVGNDITLNTNALLNAFVTIQGVYRNGQLVSQSGWIRSSNLITVYNAADSDAFQVAYGYAAASIVTTTFDSVSASQVGNDIQLNTNSLTHTYVTILGVYRNGQLLSSASWSQASNLITVPNTDAGEDYQIQYTY